MNSLPYGSLSPTISFSPNPDSVETLERGESPVSLTELRKFVSLYDDTDDNLVLTLSQGVLNQLELYANIHATHSVARALYMYPQRYISLPFGPHNDVLTLERYENKVWVASTDYNVIGLNFKRIELYDRRPVRVTFESGCDTIPPEMLSALYQEVAFRYKNRNDPQVVAAESAKGLSNTAREAMRLLNKSLLRYETA